MGPTLKNRPRKPLSGAAVAVVSSTPAVAVVVSSTTAAVAAALPPPPPYPPKNTIKGHPGAVTDIFSMGKEIFHCEKVGTKCRCVCDRSLKCALRHHHESGYKKSFTHC